MQTEISHEANIDLAPWELRLLSTPPNSMIFIERYASTKNAVKRVHGRKFQSLAGVK